MKKIIALLIVTSFSLAGFAQPMTKNGMPILPQAGDYSLGIDAGALFSYLGNMFNGTQEQSPPSWDFVTSGPAFTLFGKYCETEKKFYRGRLRLGTQSFSHDFSVLSKPNATDTVLFNDEYLNDQTKTSITNINLAGGIEYRKGMGRIQGYAGPEVFIGYSSSKTSYEFANPTDTDMAAGSFAILNYTGDPNAIDYSGRRITEIKNGSTFTIGVRGFVGVEVFVMSKMSIGGEFGWGLGFSSTGNGETTTEYFEQGLNDFEGGVRVETIPTPGKSSLFRLDTDNANGEITLNFYFQ